MKTFRTIVRWVCWLAFIALCLLTLLKMLFNTFYFSHPELMHPFIATLVMVLNLLPPVLFIWINRRVERHRLAWAGAVLSCVLLLAPDLVTEGPLFSEVFAIQAGVIALPFLLTLVHRNESLSLESPSPKASDSRVME